jgi:hypothetical protein
MRMSSDYVLLGVAHRDRDLPQLGLSKSPVEPRSLALLVVMQDHSRRRRRSFCSRLVHGSSTDTRASRCGLWARSINETARTPVVGTWAFKRQNYVEGGQQHGSSSIRSRICCNMQLIEQDLDSTTTIVVIS